MSIQDSLRGMLYSGDSVVFQNAGIYKSAKSTKDLLTPYEKWKLTHPLKEEESGEKPLSFQDSWETEKKNVIEKLKEKIENKFDYIFNSSGSVLVYIRPKQNDKPHKQLKPDAIISYKPEGQIKIKPQDDTITVQAKYNMYGNDFNKHSIITTAKNNEDVVNEIANVAVSLAKVLNII